MVKRSVWVHDGLWIDLRQQIHRLWFGCVGTLLWERFWWGIVITCHGGALRATAIGDPVLAGGGRRKEGDASSGRDTATPGQGDGSEQSKGHRLGVV
jgi:hypothetical protein